MTTQVFVASTAFGLATLVAALDDGAFDPARRVLVVSNNAGVPETAVDLTDFDGVGVLLERFDHVYRYNADIAPQHPTSWAPRVVDLPLWERYFRGRWALGDDDLHLVIESIQAPPAHALIHVFPDAAIDVYADGLMSYGPTRVALPSQVGGRLRRLLHLDLVPGLRPVLLTEWGVPGYVIGADAFRRTVAAMTPARTASSSTEQVLLLGQYLAAADLLSVPEESQLHLEMIRGAVALGYRSLVFKPHPTAPALARTPLQREAERLGARLTVRTEPELAESLFDSGDIALVVGCFSTALMTARSLYGLPVARVGTELILERLRPYQNSNRIPATLIDALVPDLADLGGAVDSAGPRADPALDVTELVGAVSYAMQPTRYPDARAQTVAFLTANLPLSARYFKRRRLTALDLPGALPPRLARPPAPQPLPRKARRVARIARRMAAGPPGSKRSTVGRTPDGAARGNER